MSFEDSNSPKWNEVLGKLRHDVYHRPEYVNICARWEGGTPHAFICQRGDQICLIPLVLRKDEIAFDGRSPYGYASPIFSEECDKDFQLQALEQFSSSAAEIGLISSYVHLHPLLQPYLPKVLNCEVVRQGPTIVISTQSSDEAWLSDISTNHRRDIRKLRRAGFHVQIEDAAGMDHFAPLYLATMQRHRASSQYMFNRVYFEDLFSKLEGMIFLVTVRSPEGQIACGGIFFYVSDIAQYHLGGTSEGFLGAAPSKLMFAGARTEAARRGANTLHLGGGLGSREDSLFRFKQAFGGTKLDFTTARFVHQPIAYKRLCALNDVEDGGKFFPAYRKPNKTDDLVAP